ncbi:hypothetical protein M758_2G091800 [Ceratodon purpureus]|nr:hypothetical protein M758_2G091800 [Ceratodon purpureus]
MANLATKTGNPFPSSLELALNQPQTSTITSPEIDHHLRKRALTESKTQHLRKARAAGAI